MGNMQCLNPKKDSTSRPDRPEESRTQEPKAEGLSRPRFDPPNEPRVGESSAEGPSRSLHHPPNEPHVGESKAEDLPRLRYNLPTEYCVEDRQLDRWTLRKNRVSSFDMLLEVRWLDLIARCGPTNEDMQQYALRVADPRYQKQHHHLVQQYGDREEAKNLRFLFDQFVPAGRPLGKKAAETTARILTPLIKAERTAYLAKDPDFVPTFRILDMRDEYCIITLVGLSCYQAARRAPAGSALPPRQQPPRPSASTAARDASPPSHQQPPPQQPSSHTVAPTVPRASSSSQQRSKSGSPRPQKSTVG